MATITSINPFPYDVRTAFEAYISSPTYYNREQFSHQKWSQIRTILEDPTAFTPHNKESINLKHHTLSSFKLVNNKIYKQSDKRSDKQHLRYVFQKAEVFDVIAQEHLKLLHAGRNKVWPIIRQKYYGIKREDVEFILKRCKNCTLNRPNTTKAPLVSIISGRAWERVQIELIDMRHDPSGQYKWILHIKDHFSKYTQLYPLKSKHAEPIADCFALFIAAFLPPKIMQADNGKEFKGALLILLRKYGIQVVNGAPRSPQTQGLVEQANGVVENKIRAWKIDHGSTYWKDGLLEVTLAMNTQIHSTIGCAPAELLFRERSSYIDWLNSQARKDLAIGVEQEDPTMGPIFESELQSELEPEALLDPRLRRAPEPRTELYSSELNSEPSSGSEPEPELNSELRRGTRARVPAQPRTELPDPVIEKAIAATQRARISMIRKYTKKHDIQHFDIGAIVSIKVPREDRTSTDNKRIFTHILEEPYPHRYRILTASGIIQRLIPTKSLGVVEQALWADIVIPASTKQVGLGLAAREASTSARVGIS
ncbi:hypothetical protein V499_00018 [Pseudogymnoascus sp. VKM F-103]|nr:hypothetical protein V499_00018 [Pseudogymnoascus sp. VKM F-103]